MVTMKKFLLPALVSLSLSACSTNFAPTTYSLTVNVAGVSTATVIVTDTTANKQVFNSAVTGTATIPDLTEAHTYAVAGQAVAGFATPATQTVSLTKNTAVSLLYTAN